jgi:hypothetical protein
MTSGEPLAPREGDAPAPAARAGAVQAARATRGHGRSPLGLDSAEHAATLEMPEQSTCFPRHSAPYGATQASRSEAPLTRSHSPNPSRYLYLYLCPSHYLNRPPSPVPHQRLDLDHTLRNNPRLPAAARVRQKAGTAFCLTASPERTIRDQDRIQPPRGQCRETAAVLCPLQRSPPRLYQPHQRADDAIEERNELGRHGTDDAQRLRRLETSERFARRRWIWAFRRGPSARSVMCVDASPSGVQRLGGHVSTPTSRLAGSLATDELRLAPLDRRTFPSAAAAK